MKYAIVGILGAIALIVVGINTPKDSDAILGVLSITFLAIGVGIFFEKVME